METKIALIKERVKRLDKDVRKLQRGLSRLQWTLVGGAVSVSGTLIWSTLYLAAHATIQLK